MAARSSDPAEASPGALVQGKADGKWYLGTLVCLDTSTHHWTVAFTVRPKPPSPHRGPNAACITLGLS